MRKSIIAVAAIIAATACSDATAPEAVAPRATSIDSVTTPSVLASSVAPASLFTDYHTSSHHWSHITTMMTDFYYSWTSSERAWAGAHYDFAMSGDGSAWKSANPTVGHLTYALLWSVITSGNTGLASGYISDMTAWFRAHPQYSMETAFSHRKYTSITAANRVAYSHWGTSRLALNPQDAGAVAYTVSRIQRLIANDGGVFFDEAATGDMKANLGPLLEYDSSGQYFAAIARMLAAIKAGVGSKMVMLNTAEYTTDADLADAAAAGSVHLEMFNNFKYSGMIDRWQWINKLNSQGVFVDLVSAYSSQDMPGMTSYPAGNSPNNTQRAKLWEIASYYLAVTDPKLLALQLENEWSKPYSSLWMKAQEVNIGSPTANRYQHATGTDPMGNQYIAYRRDFDKAMVLLRLQQGWGSESYTDGSAISITLPVGETWIPLNADGTVGSPVTSIRLRNSEAAILLRGSKL